MPSARTGLLPVTEEPVGDEFAERLAASAGTVRRSTAELEGWLADRRRSNPFQVDRVPLAELEGWELDSESGHLVHRSGRFFAVEGAHVRTDHGPVPEWWQPIIRQQDVAILGILVREIDGVLHFLMQAKMEPGNFNAVQYSPTVQATSSNYLRAHNGAASRYLEHFVDPARRTLVDVLQSEQGSWFLAKRNRNIVVETTDEVPAHDDFAWLTLGELFLLLRRPHLLNMDARTVLSCLPVPIPNWRGDPRYPAATVRSWLTERKAAYTLTTRPVPLAAVRGWRRTGDAIEHQDGRYFEMIGVSVRASNREVRAWGQPLLSPVAPGLVAFVVRRFGGVPHVLARTDVRPGYRDVAEIGPTVQCTPANFAAGPSGRRPALLDFVLGGGGTVRYDETQSEEGGRFQRAATRHLIVEVDHDPEPEPSSDFRWLAVDQLAALTQASYQVDIEARSLLLCLYAMHWEREAQ